MVSVHASVDPRTGLLVPRPNQLVAFLFSGQPLTSTAMCYRLCATGIQATTQTSLHVENEEAGGVGVGEGTGMNIL